MKQVTFPFLCLVIVFATHAQEPTDVPSAAEPYQKEIRKLAGKKKLEAAFDVIEALEPRSLKDLIYLTEIPAPPFMEQERAEAFRLLLEEAGADSVWIDAVGNVLALRKGAVGERTVVLDAHLDTVFPPETDVTVQIDGDTLRAPGVGDDTRGLVVVLTVLRALQTADIKTRDHIVIVGTVGEEGVGDLRGVKHIFSQESAVKVGAWIAVDGGDIGRIATQGIGSHRYRVTFKGPGGHSWGAFGLGNPHHALGLAIRNFVSTADPFTREGPKTSYNVGRIGGGTSINSIPFESWMEVDMRSENPESLNQIDALFQQAVGLAEKEINELRRMGDPIVAEVEMIGNRPSGELPVTTPLVQRAVAATAYFGATPRIGSGSTNSNIPISLGIPAVTIGRGGKGSGAHSLSEWWLNENGDDAIKLALLLVVAEAGLD